MIKVPLRIKQVLVYNAIVVLYKIRGGTPATRIIPEAVVIGGMKRAAGCTKVRRNRVSRLAPKQAVRSVVLALFILQPILAIPTC